MKALGSGLAVAVLGAALWACGGTGKTSSFQATPPTSIGSPAPRSAATTTARSSYVRADGDRDGDDSSQPAASGHTDDEALSASYGEKASGAESRAITALVKRYYAASLDGDGASACALLSAEVAKGLGAGPRLCATAIQPLLAEQHRHLAAEEPATMTVIDVYARHNVALVVLGFKHEPEGDIVVERENGGWKVGALFDSQMT